MNALSVALRAVIIQRGALAAHSSKKLAALMDADRRRESHFLARPFQYRHEVAAAEGEQWRQCRREA
ncbi:hypothetical protein [Bradyrhizobium nanningense]|uniref:hypothetical protein n=1 Tax=Bradyrhizobium nanningense TaxID=1325118 RepID=UPI0013E8DE92|nr:hypothetical protein [Bradyrhizobium nanningense]